MKDKIKDTVVLCFVIIGIILLSCYIWNYFGDKNSSPFLLLGGMLCATIGNFIQGISIYKRRKQK